MEWLNRKCQFGNVDFKLLRFHPEEVQSSNIETIRLFKDAKGNVELEHEKHASEEQLRNWVSTHCALPTASCSSDLILVMMPRLGTVEHELPVTALPCHQETFQETARSMFQHRSLSLLFRGGFPAAFHSLPVKWDKQPGSSLVYNCRSDTVSSTGRRDIALSVTCFPEVPITFAIMYGAGDFARSMAKTYLRQFQSSGQTAHPMLLPVLFVEIERKRFFDLLDGEKTNLKQRILELETKARRESNASDKSEKAESRSGERTATMRDCESTKLWMSASSLKVGLENLKMQVSRMLGHSKTLSQSEFVFDGQGTDKYIGQRQMGEMIEARLLDITAEFDNNIRTFNSLLGGMNMAAQMEWNYYARKDAKVTMYIAFAAKRDGSQMRGISLAGMIFLPGTFLATLFSMDFFNWSSSDSPQVISPYILVYIGLTALLTACTLWQWRRWSQKGDMDDAKYREVFEADNDSIV